jgi:hypothetical protein
MGTILKLLAQLVGVVILAGLILLVLWGAVKLFIFLITVCLIIVAVALALVIGGSLVVALFEIIKETLWNKDKDKKAP